ncbi:MAG: alpha/beta fold hydrolase [Alphaproteobacteria bacterium]|nr:alpha/beta fold hydrolase [Alphaproteobacteria bacterium]
MIKTLNAWLAPVKHQLPSDLSQDDAEKLYQAIMQESLRRVEAFLAGIRFYQNFPAVRNQASDVATVWQCGTTRLLDYAPLSNGPVVFVIPSLVNRFEILDIDPDHSFLQFLVSVGMRPLVIDWQEPGAEEKNFSLSDYMTQRLVPALDYANQIKVGSKCHVLGYCMGGLMALALSLMKPQQITSLTLMATPWDFAPKGIGGVPSASTMLGQSFLEYARKCEAYIDQIGYMPA